MAKYTNLVRPNLGVRDLAGMCLRYAQSVLGAPVNYPSAWSAWLNQKGRHSGPPPNNIVPIWFEHYGTYGSPPRHANWGHVAVYVPGDAIYTSPSVPGRVGFERYATIQQIERVFGARYVGWSEYMNGKQIVRRVAATPPKPKETKVRHYHRKDKFARAGGRNLNAGQHLYLNTVNGTRSQATNVVGGIGSYSITPHIYAEGKPGDRIILSLMWQDTRSNPRRNSNHYQEELVIGESGTLKANREFKRAVSKGYAVYVKASAPSDNKGAVKITMLDCDSYLFLNA